MNHNYENNLTIIGTVFSKLKKSGAIFLKDSDLEHFNIIGCFFFDCMNTYSSGGSMAVFSNSQIKINSNCFKMCRTYLQGNLQDFGQAYHVEGTKSFESMHSTVYNCPEKNIYNHSPIAAFCPNAIIQNANVSSNDCSEGGCVSNHYNDLVTMYRNTYFNNTSTRPWSHCAV